MVTHTTVQKFRVSVFLKEVFYAHKSCIYLIKNTVKKKLILWNIITILNNFFYCIIF